MIYLMGVTDNITAAEPYFLAFYGVIAYYAIRFLIWKKLHKAGKFKQWAKEALAGFVVTLIIVPLVVIFNQETGTLLNKMFTLGLAIGPWVYITAGPVTDLLTRGFVKLIS